MKNFIFAVVVALVLLIFCTSCGWEVEIVDPTKPSESEAEIVVPEEEKEEEQKVLENSETAEEGSESAEQEEYVEKGEPPISCENVVLETSRGSIYKSLEFEDRIIIYYVEGSIAAFDIETGEEIYEFYFGDVNENGAFDIVKTDYKEGFDYRILTKDKIAYFSSKNDGLIEEIYLPETVAKDIADSRFMMAYSIYGDKIIWQSKDGIKIINTETGEEELLLSNDLIESVIIPSAEKAIPERTFYVDYAPYFFYNPKFICDGEKIAVSVTNERFIFWATALYNIEKEGFEWSYAYDEMLNADYPFADKFISIGGRRFINAENGNEILFDEFTRSFDGTNFFRIEYDDMDMHGFKAFMGDRNSIINGGTEIFSLTNDVATAHIDNIFENYLLVCVHEEGTEWNCLVKYK